MHEGEGAYIIPEEGVDADRQIKQCLDSGVPEGAQRVNGETVSDCGAELLWGRATVLGVIGGTTNTTKIGKEWQANETNVV